MGCGFICLHFPNSRFMVTATLSLSWNFKRDTNLKTISRKVKENWYVICCLHFISKYLLTFHKSLIKASRINLKWHFNPSYLRFFLLIHLELSLLGEIKCGLIIKNSGEIRNFPKRHIIGSINPTEELF